MRPRRKNIIPALFPRRLRLTTARPNLQPIVSYSTLSMMICCVTFYGNDEDVPVPLYTMNLSLYSAGFDVKPVIRRELQPMELNGSLK